VNRKEVAYDEEQIVHGDQLIFDMASGEGISAQDVSEGTLLTLSLLTLLHGEPAPRVLLLDDVERGLHPRAQRDLIEQLRKVLELRPELQIILSSHSPYVIDQLKPEEVWLLAPDTEGCAVSRRLADHPNAVRALEVLTTGEFWSAEGEDWVLNEAAK
jgi:predicted ATPase